MVKDFSKLSRSKRSLLKEYKVSPSYFFKQSAKEKKLFLDFLSYRHKYDLILDVVNKDGWSSKNVVNSLKFLNNMKKVIKKYLSGVDKKSVKFSNAKKNLNDVVKDIKKLEKLKVKPSKKTMNFGFLSSRIFRVVFGSIFFLCIVIALFLSLGFFVSSTVNEYKFCNSDPLYSQTFCVLDSIISNTFFSSSVNESIGDPIVWVGHNVVYSSNGEKYSGNFSGSGVIINSSEDGIIVYTNRHVVDCSFQQNISCNDRFSESFFVRTPDGVFHNVSNVYFSSSNIDLAILIFNSSNYSDYSAANYTSSFKEGDSVVAVGYPSSDLEGNYVEFSISEGRILGFKKILEQSSGSSFRSIESTVSTSFGSSGGGLFTSSGNLIGINTWSSSGRSIAIDISSINLEFFVNCPLNNYFKDDSCVPYTS